MSDDPFLDAIYVEGTNTVKPGLIGLLVSAAIIVVIAVLIGLYSLARHIEAHVRWRLHLRRVGCADAAQRNSRINNKQNLRETSVIIVGVSSDPSPSLLDTNNNQVRINYPGSTTVQIAHETTNPRINQLENTQFQNNNSDSKLQKLKATPFNIFHNNFSPVGLGFDPNNNPTSQFVNPVTFPSETETELSEELQQQTDENESEISEAQQQQAAILDSTKELPYPSNDDDRKWWDVSNISSLADVDQENTDTDPLPRRKLSENTRTASIAGSLVLMTQQEAPGPNTYVIPESYVLFPGPGEIAWSDKMKELPKFLEYSQAEGGWVRKKFENYVPGTSHKYTYPKDEYILGLGYGYLARILEPINRFVTSLVTPDPSSITIDVIDRPAQFNLTEYTDSDQQQIEAEIQRLTRKRSMGIVSFLDLMQGEGCLRTEDPRFQQPELKDSVLLSTPPNSVSNVSENESASLAASVISVKKGISVPAIIEPLIYKKPKKCCCC